MAAEEELFEIALSSIDRTLNVDTHDEVFDIEFDCTRESAIVNITVSIDVEVVTTLEIMPFGMSELNRASAPWPSRRGRGGSHRDELHLDRGAFMPERSVSQRRRILPLAPEILHEAEILTSSQAYCHSRYNFTGGGMHCCPREETRTCLPGSPPCPRASINASLAQQVA